MAKFWKIANDIIKDADIILEVLDARNIEGSRNEEIEHKVRSSDKTIIYVVNKCDLVNKETLEKETKQIKDCIFVSSTAYHGFLKLKSKIMMEAKRMGIKKPKVGVVGYPNIGKSSVINALKGKHSARASSESGFTKGVQFIATRNYLLMDTPGVISYQEKDERKLGSIGAVDFSKVKDPEDVALELLEKRLKLFQDFYKIKEEDEEFLEALAMKYNFLAKKGMPDTKRSARKLLQDWQNGQIKIK
ncbi:50S ribosome-binding GTPase [Candidatus Woesearchaeota archaeon]|nr:50S ribosome-binding GTPase [Candidatus Woesearchaeota archaeon]